MSEVCPDCGPEAEIIGVEIWGAYDGVLFWQCCACGRRFHRWPEDHFLRRRAERFIERTDQPGEV